MNIPSVNYGKTANIEGTIPLGTEVISTSSFDFIFGWPISFLY
jgi:hypothetical protein